MCRSAFASRLCSTRSTLSGAHRAVTDSPTCASSVTCRARASASTPRRHERDEAGELRLAQLERQRAAVDPRELEEVVGERRERANLVAQRGQVLARARRARPRPPRASPACSRAASAGRGSPRRRARGGRRRAARGSPPSRRTCPRARAARQAPARRARAVRSPRESAARRARAATVPTRSSARRGAPRRARP